MSTFVHSIALMDTVVSFHVPLHDSAPDHCKALIDRGVDWFQKVEQSCSRFRPDSEVTHLAHRAGTPVAVTEVLLQSVQFALALAKETDGAFDPTVGAAMEARGFNVEYRTRNVVQSALTAERVTFRDVTMDVTARTITLTQPLMLDLGAVAKGLAVDLAARELAPLGDFMIDAGGDVYASGLNDDGRPWAIGVRHPRQRNALIDTLHVSNSAACTSGDYDRRGTNDVGHIMDPRTGGEATAVASATVMAPSAMVADGLATAAFVLGPVKGIELLERNGALGFLITPDLTRYSTHDA
ncbi:MAG TPA: FAD:protein FMN transferase [Gemmatimonadaceae bacterium]